MSFASRHNPQAYSHINTAASQSTFFHRREQPIMFGPFGPIPTGPSSLARFQAMQENKPPVNINTLWPDLSEQAKAAETAQYRSRGANENPQSDTASERPKIQPRARRTKAWVPFDFADSEIDTPSNNEEQRRAAPFDVHAKVFEPTPSHASAGRETPFGLDDIFASAGGDFRPMASRQPPRPTGLNAYEVLPDLRALTVAAPYNIREIRLVFGTDLPGPEFCSANPGERNGQVQFVIHPNGDISAQQWSSPQYQWLNIGQYSNIRKRTEGQLASERLRGETEQQSLQQKTLSYFRAIGLQRQAAVMGLPFSFQQIQDCMPNAQASESFQLDGTPMRRQPRAGIDQAFAGLGATRGSEQSDNHWPIGNLGQTTAQGRSLSPSVSRAGVPTNWQIAGLEAALTDHSTDNTGGSPSTLANTASDIAHMSAQGGPPPGMYSAKAQDQRPINVQAQRPDPLAALTFGSLPALSRQLTDTPYGGRDQTSTVTTQRANLSRTGPKLVDPQPQPMTMSSDGEDSSNYADMFSAFMTSTSLVNDSQNPFDASTNEMGATGGNLRSAAQNVPSLDQPNDLGSMKDSFEKHTRAQSGRVAVKDFLQRLGDSASARGSAGGSGARTVLHDPLQSRSTRSPSESPANGHRLGVGLQTSRHVAQGRTVYGNTHSDVPSTRAVPSFRFPSEPAKDLGISDPEPGWKDRPVEVINVNTPQMSHDQLAMYAKPSPQIWNGPFFASSPSQIQFGAPTQKSYDAELSEWFHGGNKAERQEEFFRRICATNKNIPLSTPAKPSKLGPIGRPSAGLTPKRNLEDEPGYINEITTRLLIPVLENLSSYVEGPIEKRHGFGARFVKPPEWCIDKGPNGNDSFFGDDWGQPPQRIGRDQRYRPVHERLAVSYDSSPLGNISGGVTFRSPTQTRDQAGVSLDRRFRLAAGPSIKY